MHSRASHGLAAQMRQRVATHSDDQHLLGGAQLAAGKGAAAGWAALSLPAVMSVLIAAAGAGLTALAAAPCCAEDKICWQSALVRSAVFESQASF